MKSFYIVASKNSKGEDIFLASECGYPWWSSYVEESSVKRFPTTVDAENYINYQFIPAYESNHVELSDRTLIVLEVLAKPIKAIRIRRKLQ